MSIERFNRLQAMLAMALTAHVANAQCLVQELYAGDPDVADGFGCALDAASEIIVVGACNDDERATNAGAVYVLEPISGSWTQTGKLLASNGASNDHFGWAASLEGEYMVIGAPDAEAAYAYRRDLSGWLEDAILLDQTGQEGDQFGYSVGVSSGWAVVGAPLNDGAGADAGAAYLFQKQGQSWSLCQKLQPNDAEAHDLFGFSVAIAGQQIVIGAPNKSIQGGARLGAVYTYEFDGTTWAEGERIHSPNWMLDSFGYAVELRSSDLIVAAPDAYEQNGSVYVFTKQSDMWSYAQTLVSAGPQSNWFGYRIALASDMIACGDLSLDWLDVFRRVMDTWVFAGRLEPSAQVGANYGHGVASVDGIVFAGDSEDDSAEESAGSVYVEQFPASTLLYCFGAACPCGNDNAGGCSNSTGAGARLTVCGSASVVADDLVMVADRLPSNQFGLFFMGASQMRLPFGDGFQCVGSGGGGLFRYVPPQHSGSGGQILLGPGIVARSGSFAGGGRIDAGETWNFQAWYRDPMGPCGASFNLSNAVSVKFVP